jgi:hypothetical protein
VKEIWIMDPGVTPTLESMKSSALKKDRELLQGFILDCVAAFEVSPELMARIVPPELRHSVTVAALARLAVAHIARTKKVRAVFISPPNKPCDQKSWICKPRTMHL